MTAERNGTADTSAPTRSVLGIDKDGIRVAQATVLCAPQDHGVTQACLSAGSGHLPLGSRAELVDAVIDLAREQHADHLAVSLPLGDTESLRRLEDRTEHLHSHAAGATALVEADLPAVPG